MDARPDYKVKNENKAIVESEVILPPVLQLPPINREEIELHAFIRYLEFIKDLCTEVPLNYLCEEDLSDAEKIKRKDCTDGIVDWVHHCNKDAGEAALMVYPYSTAVTYHMSNFKALLKAAYERKVEKARQEAKEKRRLDALKEINPPLDDAEKYLTKQEYQRFIDSLDGAADAYLDGGKGCALNDWRFDRRAVDYFGWTGIIKERKEKEAREKEAQLGYEQYLDRLSATVEKFKVELSKSKKPKFDYPPELEKYEPDSWCDLELPTKQQIQNWAEDKILDRLPEILANVTRWELSWERRGLPRAAYEAVGGIPSLTWYFETHILVTVNLELKKCVIRKRHLGYTVEVQAEGEKLGTLYLGPVPWLTPGSFTTPIPLLSAFGKDELEGPGTRVTERSSPFIRFDIEGMDEEVEVVDDFRKFIEDIAKGNALAQALLDKGLIDKETAKLVEEKAKLPLPQLVGAQAGVGDSTDDNSDVFAALEAMGYKKTEVKAAVEATQFSPGMSLEEKVKAVLKNIGT